MKIEMGESLMLSWLRHAKECKVAQLNWKPSDTWSTYNDIEVGNLLNILEQHFPVFKKSKLDQLIKQAEIDVLGLSVSDGTPYYYAIDVAYHESGLNYGSKEETIERISKKLLRSALVLLFHFNVKNGEIIFASPKINPAIYDDLNGQIIKINDFMQTQGYNYKFRLIANSDFSELVLNPIIEISSTVADTSELFMRAFQLSNLWEKSLVNKNKTSNTKPRNSVYNEFKIGKTVKTKLQYLLENKCLTEDEINNLKEEYYCKKTFNLNFPLLINKNESPFDSKGYRRYWDIIFDNRYLACSQWIEPQRASFDNWYDKIINKTAII